MMAAEARKPDIEELVGVAVQASALVIEERKNETPGLRVAALGAAVMQIRANLDRPLRKPEHMTEELWRYGERLFVRSPARRDHLEAELGRLLLRMGAGGDLTIHTLAPAAWMFAEWLQSTRTWQAEAMRPHHPRLFRFAARCILELMFCHCEGCGGCGQQERPPKGKPRRPRLFARNTKLVSCTVCHGSGAALPDIGARVDALGIVFPDYRAQQWQVHFSQAQAWLMRIARRLQRPLRKQLERGG